MKEICECKSWLIVMMKVHLHVQKQWSFKVFGSFKEIHFMNEYLLVDSLYIFRNQIRECLIAFRHISFLGRHLS